MSNGTVSVSKKSLERLRLSHYECDDSWYSCPLSSGKCSNDAWAADECNCGASEHNKVIDDILAAAPNATQASTAESRLREVAEKVQEACAKKADENWRSSGVKLGDIIRALDLDVIIKE